MRGQGRAGFSSHPWIRTAWTGRSSSSCPRCGLFAKQSFLHLRDRQFGRLPLLLLLCLTALQTSLLFGQASSAADSAASLQVGHTSWTFDEGAPADVTGLAQTNDGFLWLGGPNGLFRFDGTRFEPFRSPFGDRLLSTNLYSLFGPRSGGLWVGYVFGGFSFLNHGRVTNYGGEIASSTGSVFGFAQDRGGIVWAATSSGLWRFDQLRWQPIGVEWNAPAGSVTRVGFDSKGILWALAGNFGAPVDLIYLLPGTRHFKTAERNLSVDGFMLDADRVVMTHPGAPPTSDSSEGSEERPAAYPVLTKDAQQFLDRNNSLWISYDDKPIVMRVPKERLRGDLNRTASPAGSETYGIFPFDMAQLVDREGNIWFGDTKGIHRFSYSPLNRQEFPKGALRNADFAVAADDNGAVWISSHTSSSKADLYYVSGGKAQRRLPQVTTSFAYRAPDRTLWFSGKGCLWHLVGHDSVRVNLPREMANQFFFLQTITKDEQGGIWVSFGRHGLYRLADGIWTSYGGRDDLPKTGILVIEFTDSLGRVWFGYSKSQLAVLDGDRVRVFGPSDGLQVGNIMAIHGRGSEIWIGGEFGLEQFDQGRFRNIAAVNDEWLRGISGIVETANGDLWLNAISGIFHVRKAEISAALRDSNYRVKGEHFGRREGLPGIAPQVRPLPTAIEGTDGRLWFTFRNGVVWLDPAAYSEKKAASPPITIQSVAADDKSYAPAPPLSLPAHTSSVQVNYSAVSLSDPEAIRFRYKLQETDKDWHEVAEASPVNYRNLAPGSYHFSVAATDKNGVWSDKVATAEFRILPAFYQTRWFLALCILTAMALLYLFYLMRLKRVAQQVRGRMEVRLAERERIARDLHDTLLQSVQGLILKVHAGLRQIPAEEPGRQTIEKALDYADQVLAEGRDRVRNLRATAASLSDLSAAFQRVAEEISPSRAPTLRTVVEGNVRELHPAVLEESYSIGREALMNALTHSRGLHIEVEITYDSRQFRLRVRDDGRGIDPGVLEKGRRDDHWGLPGMRERATKIGAQLELWTRPGGGTEVELMVPASTAYHGVRGESKASWFRRSSHIDGE
jgi:signal transduction histidine kinase/streptogramin lyase